MAKKILVAGIMFVCMVLAFFLSFIIPKKRNLVLFIGSGDGQFRDNVKYLFLYLRRLDQKEYEFYFLTENKKVFNNLKENKLPVLFYPNISTISKLLRASIVIVDNLMWISNIKYHLLYRSYKVQLWHGCSIKSLELDNPNEIIQMNSSRKKFISIASGRFPTYDLLLSTSEINTQKIFLPAFKSKEIIETGYPRNDIFFSNMDHLDLIGADSKSLGAINDLKKKGNKIILYAPTFRDTGAGDDFIENRVLNIKKLDHFAKKYNLFFMFKIHPFRRLKYDFKNMENIYRYDDGSDIYPILPFIDLLITDYSSIFFDFLFLDKPIVFFPYDYYKYIQQDRKLKYNYSWITPGPKCNTQDELQNEIVEHLVDNKDEYVEKRQQILNMSFKDKNGRSSENIWNFIKKKNYLVLDSD